MALFGFFSKNKEEKQEEQQQLDQSLEKTKVGFFGKLTRAVAGKDKVDEEVLDELENILISGDVGLPTTIKIIKSIEERVARDKFVTTGELNKILREEVTAILDASGTKDFNQLTDVLTATPYVIMVVGVNGVGKTTTIGKLAYNFTKAGKKVLLGAGDTFRAAAVDQLKIWSERTNVPLVQKPMGYDPASVAFETVQEGLKQGVDVIIIDTAGRLHNKIGLMNELSKIKRVVEKVLPNAPHEILLVLDASTGQNAVEQAKQFTAATEVNALAVTKLDGTAKGGVVLGIVDQFKIPVKYIGVGERKEDLQLFNRHAFVDSIFKS